MTTSHSTARGLLPWSIFSRILATAECGGLSNYVQFLQLCIASPPFGLLCYSYRVVQGRHAYSLYSDIPPSPTNSHAAENYVCHT
jgi:hypothetical protein